jgi:hypothetical protein
MIDKTINDYSKHNEYIFIKPIHIRVFKKGDKVKTIEGYKGKSFTEAIVKKINKKGFHYKYFVQPVNQRSRWMIQYNLELTPEQKVIEEL